MHHIRTSLLVAFILTLGSFTSPLFAQDADPVIVSEKVTADVTPVTTPTDAATTTRELVESQVSIQNARVASQAGPKINISFDIVNEEGTQPEVKYQTELFEKKEGKLILVDQHVDNEIWYVKENQTVKKDIVYFAPSYLNGTYEVLITLANTNGAVLAVASAGSVELRGSGEYLNVSECSLSVTGEKDIKYDPIKGVDILPREDITAHCKVTSSLKETVTITPFFKTFYRNVFGRLVLTEQPDNTALTIAPGKTVAVTWKLPKATKPQAYDITLALVNGQNSVLSNMSRFHYLIHGASATIQSVSAQKSQYVKNDVAEILLSWTPSADSFPGSRKGPTVIEAVYTDISMTDMQSGADCITPIHPLKGQDDGKNNTGGFFTYEPVIITDCKQPVITVTLSDDQGRTLDQKRVVLEGKSSNTRFFPSNTFAFGIVIGLILLALIIMVYEKMKKNETASLMKSLLFFLVAVAVLGMAPESTKAETLDAGGSYYIVSASYDSGSNTVRVDGYAKAAGWDPLVVYYGDVYLSATGVGTGGYTCYKWMPCFGELGGGGGSGSYLPINVPGTSWSGASAVLIDKARLTHGNITQTGSAVFNAPSQPGTYAISFYALTKKYELITTYVSVPYPAVCGSGIFKYPCVKYKDVPLPPYPGWTEASASTEIQFTVSGGGGGGGGGGGSVCGNGAIESGEQCDGSNLGGSSCSSQGFTGGSLSCTSSCKFNTSQCSSGSYCAPPDISFYVDPDYVDYGGEATLSWSVSNATSCTLDGSGVGTSGSRGTGSLTGSQSYSLSCSNSCSNGGNASAQSSAWVTVGAEAPPASGAYVSIWADDSFVASGEGTTLHWDSRDVSNCYASGGWDGGKNTSGDEWTGSLYDDTTFRITCDDDRSGGTLNDSVFIQIASAGETYGCTDSDASNYNPNATIDDGSCDYTPGSGLNINFYADPDIVAQGQSSTLYWSTQNADSCYANGGPWSGGKGTDGSEGTDSLYSDTSYSLTCENSSDSLTRSTTVTVDASRNPNLDFWSDSDSVPYDSGTTLRWDAQNVDSCSASGGWSGGKGTSGEEWTGDLTSPTTYNLDCSGRYGSVSRQVRVQVQPTFFLDNSNDIKVTVVKGKPAKSSATTLTIDRRLSFSQPVTFSVSDISPSLPGATFHFTPETLDSSEYSTGALFTVTAPGNTQQRDYTITVEANGGGITRSVDVIMGVTVIDPNFKEF